MATVCQCVPSGKTGVISRRTDSWPAESNPHTAQQPTDICFSVFPVGGSTVSQTLPTVINKQLQDSYSYIRPEDYGHVWYQHSLVDNIFVTFSKTLLPPTSELNTGLTMPWSLLLSKDNEPSSLAPLLNRSETAEAAQNCIPIKHLYMGSEVLMIVVLRLTLRNRRQKVSLKDWYLSGTYQWDLKM